MSAAIDYRKANNWASKDGKYVFEKVIADGTFGTVLQAQKGKYGPKLAVLLYQLPWKNGHLRAKKFTELLGLHHRNIVEILECYEAHDPPLSNLYASKVLPPPTAIAIVTSVCISGSLDLYLQNYTINEETRLRWYRDLALGLQYLHSKDILHWDVCPSNIWIQDDRLKIANMKFSKLACDAYRQQKFLLNYGEFLSTCMKPSVPFVAPEAYKDVYSYHSDVFSLALVFLVIADAPDSGHHTAVWGNTSEYLGQLLHSKEPPRTVAPVHLLDPPISSARPQELNLINEMLKYDCGLRPDIDAVVDTISLMKIGGSGESFHYRWLCYC